MVGYPSPARIDWAPDGSRLLAFLGGAIRIHALDGSLVHDVAEGGYLDARWLSDGRIVAVDLFTHPEHFTIHGVPYGTSSERGNRIIAYAAAAIASGGAEAVVMYRSEVSVRAIGADRGRGWSFEQSHYGVQAEPERMSAALSADGRMVAVGYETRAWDDGSSRRASGRGWLVIDLMPKPTTTRRSSREQANAALLDRHWYPCIRDEGPLRFAFDRGPYSRRRLAIMAPEREAALGVLRIGSGEAVLVRKNSDAYPHKHRGGARAVALDDRGIVAAYAYPAGAGERRLRVDYLAPQPKGSAVVEILDTLWIDPDLDDIVALAFDAASHRIACLGASGSVEVVPVP